jgi:hypothetical protein
VEFFTAEEESEHGYFAQITKMSRTNGQILKVVNKLKEDASYVECRAP